jgi:hypothetical protein
MSDDEKPPPGSIDDDFVGRGADRAKIEGLGREAVPPEGAVSFLLLDAVGRCGNDRAALVARLRTVAEAVLRVDPLSREVALLDATERLRRLGFTKRAAEGLVQGALKSAFQDAQTAAQAKPEPAELARRVAELRVKAQSVLEAEDPLILVEAALEARGYGGDLRAPKVVYLAATSRCLAMRSGSMPVHTLLKAPPGAGKNYTWHVVQDLLPPEAFHVVDAGSPRVLIYDQAPLKHRVVVFTEADSLPESEDNPAASAVRNLLQDHHLHYQVVAKDETTGRFGVQDVSKPGPSVLITTAVKKLGPQMDSRLFTLEIPEDQAAIKAALAAQAKIELAGGVEAPDSAVVAFQAYLQILAPWEVQVPYVEALSGLIGRESSLGPRVNRDFARLVSLVKAVTVLRHAHRQRDAKGRWIATIEDYGIVFDLVKDIYQGSASECSQKTREAVEVVGRLTAQQDADSNGVSSHEVAVALGLSDSAGWRRVKTALRGCWLVNREQRAHHPARLVLGDPLPAPGGLPTAEQVTREMEGSGGEGSRNDCKLQPLEVCVETAPDSRPGAQTASADESSAKGPHLQFASVSDPSREPPAPPFADGFAGGFADPQGANPDPPTEDDEWRR